MFLYRFDYTLMNMKDNTPSRKNFGFTLLELLVVVGVIGALTTVILFSVSQSRNKARDASIKTSLTSVRGAAAVYRNDYSDFGTFTSGACPSVANTTSAASGVFYDAEVKKTIQGAAVTAGGSAQGSGATATYTKTACASNGTSWVAAVVLVSSTSSAWCVDANGVSRAVSITADMPSTGYSTSTYTCN